MTYYYHINDNDANDYGEMTMQYLVNGQTIKADNYDYIVERHGRTVRLSGGTDSERKQVAMRCIRELEFVANKKRGRNKIGNVSITL